MNVQEIKKEWTLKIDEKELGPNKENFKLAIFTSSFRSGHSRGEFKIGDLILIDFSRNSLDFKPNFTIVPLDEEFPYRLGNVESDILNKILILA